MSMARPAARRGGFTLLEVLVAGLIAALALGALFRAEGGGLGQAAAATQYQRAVAVARSRLALAAIDPAPGEAAGRDGPFAWRTRTAPVAASAPDADLARWVSHPGELPATLYEIETVVRWPGGLRARSLRLATRRIGFAAPAPAPP